MNNFANTDFWCSVGLCLFRVFFSKGADRVGRQGQERGWEASTSAQGVQWESAEADSREWAGENRREEGVLWGGREVGWWGKGQACQVGWHQEKEVGGIKVSTSWVFFRLVEDSCGCQWASFIWVVVFVYSIDLLALFKEMDIQKKANIQSLTLFKVNKNPKYLIFL